MKESMKNFFSSLLIVPFVTLMDTFFTGWIMCGVSSLFTLSQLGIVGIETKPVRLEHVYSIPNGCYIDVLNVGYFSIWLSLLCGIIIFFLVCFYYNKFYSSESREHCSLSTVIGIVINITIVLFSSHLAVQCIVEKYTSQVPYMVEYVGVFEVILAIAYIASLIFSAIKHESVESFFVIK